MDPQAILDMLESRGDTEYEDSDSDESRGNNISDSDEQKEDDASLSDSGKANYSTVEEAPENEDIPLIGQENIEVEREPVNDSKAEESLSSAKSSASSTEDNSDSSKERKVRKKKFRKKKSSSDSSDGTVVTPAKRKSKMVQSKRCPEDSVSDSIKERSNRNKKVRKSSSFLDGSDSSDPEVTTPAKGKTSMEDSDPDDPKEVKEKKIVKNKTPMKGVSNNNVIVIGEDKESGDEVEVMDNKHDKGEKGKPRWKGKDLYPPVRTSQGKRSKVWMYSGFQKTASGHLDTSQTICGICGICGVTKKYKNSPGVMLQHLTQYHPNEFKTESKNTPSVSSFFPKSPTKEIHKYPQNHPRQKLGREKLVHWVCKSNRPLSIVEDTSFREFAELLDPKFSVPSANTIGRDVEKLYEVKKEELKEELSTIPFAAGCNDAGSSIDGRSFVDINIFHVTDDFELKKEVLGVVEMKEAKNAENYREKVKKIEEDFGVEGKVHAYTTDNEATMHKAFRKDTRTGCFAHIQSKGSQKSLESTKPLKKIRKKMRKLAKKFNKTHKFKYALERNQKARNLRTKTIKQEVKTRFTSTHTLFHSILNDSNQKEGACSTREISENVEAINESLEEAKVKGRESLKVTQADVNMMCNTVKVLDTLEESITLLGGAKYSTASVVLPFEKYIMEKLQEDDMDPVYLHDFKKTLKEDLEARFDKNLDRELLAKCSFFDGRYKDLGFLNSDEKEKVEIDIKKELDDLEAQGQFEKEPKKNQEKQVKRSRFLGEFDQSDEEDETVEEEFNRYKADKKLKSESNPFDFWKSRKENFPRLAFLARKYLCVQVKFTFICIRIDAFDLNIKF